MNLYIFINKKNAKMKKREGSQKNLSLFCVENIQKHNFFSVKLIVPRGWVIFFVSRSWVIFFCPKKLGDFFCPESLVIFFVPRGWMIFLS